MFTLPTAMVVVVALLLAVFRFQTSLLFDAAPVLGASLGAAVKVPAWAGRGPGDHVVVVPVAPKVDTTDFDLPKEVRRKVIKNACDVNATACSANPRGRNRRSRRRPSGRRCRPNCPGRGI